MAIDHQRLARMIEAARAYHDAWDRLAREITLAQQRCALGEPPGNLLAALWQISMLEARPDAAFLETLIAEETWHRARGRENARRQAKRRGERDAKRPAAPQPFTPPQGIEDPQASDIFAPGASALSAERQAELDAEIENLIGGIHDQR